MKIVRIETLVSRGVFPSTNEWLAIRESVHRSVRLCEWPPGAGSFTICPQSGKKRGEGNGVRPIRNAGIAHLKSMRILGRQWNLEEDWPVHPEKRRPGKVDAVFHGPSGPACFEWETGNISSSHRSLNKMALGLLNGTIVAGILAVPSRKLYKFLTDRVGNIVEIEPYFDLWRSINCDNGVFEIVVFEHDATSPDVPRIPKGTDGRALL